MGGGEGGGLTRSSDTEPLGLLGQMDVCREQLFCHNSKEFLVRPTNRIKDGASGSIQRFLKIRRLLKATLKKKSKKPVG